jgi:hypothetical protein
LEDLEWRVNKIEDILGNMVQAMEKFTELLQREYGKDGGRRNEEG